MVRELNGLELQSFIKSRQLRQVRNLRQEYKIIPKLVIIMSDDAGDVIKTYVRMKKRYAEDIEIEVDIREYSMDEIANGIREANNDKSVQGIIVQLPISDKSRTDEICNLIAPQKDVDGLGNNSGFLSATAQAIDWLIAGYSIDLSDKDIVIVGNGKLVGNPLFRMWQNRGLSVKVVDKETKNADKIIARSDVIVTATGVPRRISSDLVKDKAVVVDAGTASEDGKIIGDVADDVRARNDVTITPVRGGVGPMTYTVLFDHLIEACLKIAGQL